MVSIKGLSKGAVLASLYNAVRPAHAEPALAMSDREGELWVRGRAWLDEPERLKFEKFFGARLFVDLTGDEFDPAGYDQAHGYGAAEAVIAKLRGTT
jgi:hypothetical protein